MVAIDPKMMEQLKKIRLKNKKERMQVKKEEVDIKKRKNRGKERMIEMINRTNMMNKMMKGY